MVSSSGTRILQARGDTVIIRQDPIPSVTRGGIHLPQAVNMDTHRERLKSIHFGTIIAIGPKTPDWLQVGQRVAYDIVPQSFELDGETLHTVPHEDVLGELEDA